jgi:hypothetical protein
LAIVARFWWNDHEITAMSYIVSDTVKEIYRKTKNIRVQMLFGMAAL